MTNKQIIIDGVDVSGCECFYINASHPERKECINPYCKGLCEDNPNCCYKQLKRKEQECEELEDTAYTYKYFVKLANYRLVKIEDLQQQLDQLKAENEQLKDELSAIQHNCNCEGCRYYDDDTFKVFYECKAQKALQLSANSVTTKYCDLLKTLIEIKKIIKKHCRKCKKHEFYYFQLCCTCKYTDILQKISEVQNG